MSKFSNNLSDAQMERLALLAEECAEVVQAVAKVQRHGYESVNPLEPGDTNRKMLEIEIGHVQHAVARLVGASDLNAFSVEMAQRIKADKITRWLHHQPSDVQR